MVSKWWYLFGALIVMCVLLRGYILVTEAPGTVGYKIAQAITSVVIAYYAFRGVTRSG